VARKHLPSVTRPARRSTDGPQNGIGHKLFPISQEQQRTLTWTRPLIASRFAADLLLQCANRRVRDLAGNNITVLRLAS